MGESAVELFIIISPSQHPALWGIAGAPINPLNNPCNIPPYGVLLGAILGNLITLSGETDWGTYTLNLTLIALSETTR